MYLLIVAARVLAVSDGVMAQASEGRWPRICARPTFQRQAGEMGRCDHVL